MYIASMLYIIDGGVEKRPKHKKKILHKTRDISIYKMKKSGASLQQIAGVYKLSTARIRQIIKRKSRHDRNKKG